MRYAIVAALEGGCNVVDTFTRGRTRCHLAEWSARLDDRWHTGFWKAVSSEEVADGE